MDVSNESMPSSPPRSDGPGTAAPKQLASGTALWALSILTALAVTASLGLAYLVVSEAQLRIAWQERSAGVRDHHERLQKEVGALLTQIAEMTSVANSLRQTKDQAESERVKVQTDLDTLRQQFEEKRSAAELAVRNQKKAVSELEELRARTEDARGEAQRLKTETASLQSQRDKLATDRQELEGSTARLKQENAELERGRSEIERALATLEQDRKSATSRNQALLAEARDLEPKVAALNKESDSAKRQLADQQAQLQDLRRDVDAAEQRRKKLPDLRKEVETAEAAVSKNMDELASIGQQITENRTRLAAAQPDLVRVEAQLKDATERLKEVSDRVREAETRAKELDGVERRLAEAEKQLSGIKTESEQTESDRTRSREALLATEQALAGVTKRRAELDAGMEKFTLDLEARKKELAGLDERLRSGRQESDKLEKGRAELAVVQDESLGVRNELARLDKQRQQARETLQSLQTEIRTLESQKAELMRHAAKVSDSTTGIATEPAAAEGPPRPPASIDSRESGGSRK